MNTFKTRTLLLKGGRKRIIHVVAKRLVENLDTGAQLPLVGVRPFADPRPEHGLIARHVDILGPSTLHHTRGRPLPGTNGRGICYLVTRAPIRVYVDED